MHVESVRRWEPGADALYGPGGCENIISRMKSQDQVPEKEFLKKWHAANPKLWRDARYASSYQNHQIPIAVREHERLGRDAVSQAVQETSESWEEDARK